MTDPQWVNYYNTAISAGQSPQQASAYADSQIQAKAAKAKAKAKADNPNSVPHNQTRVSVPYQGPINIGKPAAQGLKGDAYRRHWQNNKQNAQNINPATDVLNNGMLDEQQKAERNAEAAKQNADEVALTRQLFKNGAGAIGAVSKAVAPILKPAAIENMRKALKPMSNHYASQFMQDKAKNLQNKAAQTEADAQKNQQIANRDYKQASAEEAITAGSAAAMNTAAQLSGASGAAAAALAGQNAGNQATNNQYQSAVARNQGRSDERRDIAAKQRRTASDDRQMATQRMQDAATLDMTQREQDEYNKLSRDLSLGNETEPDDDVTQNIIDNIYWRR